MEDYTEKVLFYLPWNAKTVETLRTCSITNKHEIATKTTCIVYNI